MRHLRTSMLALSITTVVSVLSACASQPQVPIVAKCPRFPEAPPSLLDPPKASNALPRLEVELQSLVETARPTPRD